MTGSDNIPTLSWCFREASTVNSIVADLLRVHAETNSGALLTLSVFYQPGPLNTMLDDASCNFDLPDNNFLSFFGSKYCSSQSAGLWTLWHPPSRITSCVVSVLRKRMSWMATLLTTARPSQWQRSFKCTAIGSVTDNGLSSLKSEQTWCLQRSELLPRSTYWMDVTIPKNHVAPPPTTLISSSAASSAPIPFRTPHLLPEACPPSTCCGCCQEHKI